MQTLHLVQPDTMPTQKPSIPRDYAEPYTAEQAHEDYMAALGDKVVLADRAADWIAYVCLAIIAGFLFGISL